MMTRWRTEVGSILGDAKRICKWKGKKKNETNVKI
jgi:hypothetical protein